MLSITVTDGAGGYVLTSKSERKGRDMTGVTVLGERGRGFLCGESWGKCLVLQSVPVTGVWEQETDY